METGIDGGIGKQGMAYVGIAKVRLNVACDPHTVPTAQFTLQIDALADGRIGLEAEAIPKLGLTHQDKRQRTSANPSER